MSRKEKSWKDMTLAAVSSKSSIGFMTGDWKTYMPVRDLEKCTKCLTCVMICPEGAIRWRPELGKIEFDFKLLQRLRNMRQRMPNKSNNNENA